MHTHGTATLSSGPYPNDPLLNVPGIAGVLMSSARFHVVQVSNGWIVIDSYSSSAQAWFIEPTIEEAGRRMAACVAHAEVERERVHKAMESMRENVHPTPLQTYPSPVVGIGGTSDWHIQYSNNTDA